jgi:hypothetical protein
MEQGGVFLSVLKPKNTPHLSRHAVFRMITKGDNRSEKISLSFRFRNHWKHVRIPPEQNQDEHYLVMRRKQNAKAN